MSTSHHHEDDVRVEVTLPAPIETAWTWVRDPDLINRWHGWEAESLAAEIQFIFVDHAEADEEARTILFGGHLFTFEARGNDTTVVTVTRSGAALAEEWSEKFYDDVEHGWTMFLQQLRFALERHRDEERRTVFLFGRRSDNTPTAGALGLSDLATRAPGTPYTLSSPTGDELAGEVWFSTDHEVGFTVDAWGDGLLIMSTGHPEPEGAPSMAILTVYGKTDAEVDALRERWTSWWDDNHTAAQLTY